MSRGLEIGLHLTPDLPDEIFIATALGNLVAYRLQEERKETLQWQVLRIVGTGPHHYRLILRHPERSLDLGLAGDVKRLLESISELSPSQLRESLKAAESSGLKPVPLRTVEETSDLWEDDFWKYFY